MCKIFPSPPGKPWVRWIAHMMSCTSTGRSTTWIMPPITTLSAVKLVLTLQPSSLRRVIPASGLKLPGWMPSSNSGLMKSGKSSDYNPHLYPGAQIAVRQAALLRNLSHCHVKKERYIRMAQRILFTLTSMIVLASLVLGACSTLPGQVAQPVNLKIAVLPILDALPMYVANQKGYFQDLGVNVEFIPVASA